MSMAIGVQQGKSDMFVKWAVMLFPTAEEAVRHGMTMNEFESEPFGGWLCKA